MGTTFKDKIYLLNEEIKRDSLQLGDLTVKRDEYGISIYLGKKSLCSFNEGGMVTLMHWIAEQKTTYKEIVTFDTQEELNQSLRKDTEKDE